MGYRKDTSPKEQPGDKIWLLKSGSQILGPLSFNDVADGLRSHKVGVLDEVKPPNGRWRFLKEVQVFEEVIRLRLNDDATGVFTQTLTVDRPGDDLTPTPRFDVATVTEKIPAPQAAATSPVKPPSMDKPPLPPVTELKPTDNAAKPSVTEIKSYAADSDTTVRSIFEEQNRRSKIFWTIVSLGVLIGASVFFYKNSNHPTVSVEQKSEIIRLAKRYIEIGDYEKALTFAQRITKIEDLLDSEKKSLLPAWVMGNQQTVETRRYIDSYLKPVAKSEEEKSDVQLWTALTLIKDKNYPEAEATLKEAVSHLPSNAKAKINLALVFLLSNQTPKAAAIVDDLSQKSSLGEALSILTGMILLETRPFPKESAARLLIELKSWAKAPEYPWANRLVRAAIYDHLGEHKEKMVLLNSLLDLPPSEKDKYLHDWQISPALYSSERMADLLDGLIAKSTEPWAKGLNAVALYFRGDVAKALESIDQARKQYSKEASLIALHAFFLKESSRMPEAKSVLQSDDNKSFAFRYLLNATICIEESDFKCSDTMIKELTAVPDSSLWVFWLKALSSQKRNLKEQARGFVEQGLKINEKFQPLLILREELND